MDQDPSSDGDPVVPSQSRRRLVGALGAGAVGAWVVPAIVSSTPASAGAVSLCGACAGANLVVNGDASSGTSGWVASVGTLVDIDLLGVHLFSGVTTVLGTTVSASQTIDLSGCAGVIAAGGVFVTVSAVGGSLLQGLDVQLTAVFNDGAATVALDQTVSGPLQPITDFVPVPVDATSLTIEFSFLSNVPLIGPILAGIDDILVSLDCDVIV